MPNARLEIIDKSGHYVHMDTPQVLAQLVTEFLGEDARPKPVNPAISENYIRETA